MFECQGRKSGLCSIERVGRTLESQEKLYRPRCSGLHKSGIRSKHQACTPTTTNEATTKDSEREFSRYHHTGI